MLITVKETHICPEDWSRFNWMTRHNDNTLSLSFQAMVNIQSHCLEVQNLLAVKQRVHLPLIPYCKAGAESHFWACNLILADCLSFPVFLVDYFLLMKDACLLRLHTHIIGAAVLTHKFLKKFLCSRDFSCRLDLDHIRSRHLTLAGVDFVVQQVIFSWFCIQTWILPAVVTGWKATVPLSELE